MNSQPQNELKTRESPVAETSLLSSWLDEDLIMQILTRIHAGYFGISLSLGWQSLLWKMLLLPTKDSLMVTYHVPKAVSGAVLTVTWGFTLFVMVVLSLLYCLKCIFSFRLVKAEFMHHVGVNYFFAPWISWLLVLESAPFVTPRHVSFVVLWWLFAVPIVVLDLKIYGQWFTKGSKINLTAVANPTSQLSVIGNLVGARAAAKMEWRETAAILFSLGMVHYVVLFVTLYQRLVGGGGDRLPAMLRPVFFLFFAAPSVASVAWYSIAGRFDTASKMLFFLSLFLFASLMCRPALFKKAMKRFNLAWWAYSYPITMLALASTRYEQQVKSGFSHAIRILLSFLSLLVLLCLLIFTAFTPKRLLHLPAYDDHPTLLTPAALPIVADVSSSEAIESMGSARVKPYPGSP